MNPEEYRELLEWIVANDKNTENQDSAKKDLINL